MANINLLPWREKLREQRKKDFGISLGLTVVAAALILFGVDRYFNASISNQNEVNAYLREQIAALDEKIVEIRELQEQKEALTARMTVIQELQGNRPVIVRLFDELVRTLPEGVYYNSITRTNDNIALEGVAESNSRISALMRDLDASDWFADPDLRQVTALTGGTNAAGGQEANSNRFQLTVKVTTPALEGQPE
jgi:type IV pilus assembly protein PilN